MRDVRQIAETLAGREVVQYTSLYDVTMKCFVYKIITPGLNVVIKTDL
jgi:hypothetical protein